MFHFIVLPVLFTLAVIGIVGLVSIYFSPGGHYDGNALDALRSSMPVIAAVLMACAMLSLLTFLGLYSWRKWSLVTLIVLLILVVAVGIAASWASWSYLGAHGVLLSQVDTGLARALGYVRVGGVAAALVALLFLIYYARRARMFVTGAELREQRKLVSYDRW